MHTKSFVSAAAALLMASTGHAAVVFSDNFDTDPIALNAVPIGFTVTGGTVDIIGSNSTGSYADLLPGNGAYVDLDGSSSASGLLSLSLTLTGGVTYTASFDLAGSQRGTAETGTVLFGTSSLGYSIASDIGFTTNTLSFTPSGTGTYALSFQNDGGDNVGALLDNVVVSTNVIAAVPEPDTYALLVAGLALTGFAGRKTRRPR